MKVDATTIAAVGALFTAGGLFIQQVVGFLKERRDRRNDQQQSHARVDTVIAQSADAAVIALSKTVDALQDENARLVRRVNDLEAALNSRDVKIQSLEERLRGAEHELRAVADELAGLKNGHAG